MTGLRRILTAPGLLLALWLAHLALARLITAPVRTSSGAVGEADIYLEDGHFLFGVVELLLERPSVAGLLAQTLILALVASVLVDLVSAGGIIVRLRGRTSPSSVLAACGRWLPGMTALTVWILLARAVLVGAAVATTWIPYRFDLVIAIPLALAASATWPALQRGRCRIVLDADSPFHPRTAWSAYRYVLGHPKFWVASLALLVGKIAIVLALTGLAGWGALDPGTPWLVRASVLVTCVFTLWGTSIAVSTCQAAGHIHSPQRPLETT